VKERGWDRVYYLIVSGRRLFQVFSPKDVDY
jgi:hypothetical protein